MTPPRLPSIDLLRALAVLLVVGHHTLTPIPGIPVLGTGMELWHRHGWMGVDLFFVLSGYLVSGLLFAEFRRGGRVETGRFLIRRGFKIYPPFYVFLGFFLLLRVLIGKPVPWPTALSEALFVQNYGPRMWTHTWSLAVEEHFYLLLALGMGMAAKRGQRGMRALAVASFLACVTVGILRFQVFAAASYQMDTHYTPTHLRVDALAFGTLLSYLHHFHREGTEGQVRRWRGGLWLLGLGLVGLGAHGGLTWAGSYLSLYLGFGALLMTVVVIGEDKKSRPLGAIAKRLAFFGAWSYSVYLWHYPVVLFADRGWKALEAKGIFVPHLLAWLLTLGMVAVVGVGMGKAVEGPSLRLRERWFGTKG